MRFIFLFVLRFCARRDCLCVWRVGREKRERERESGATCCWWRHSPSRHVPGRRSGSPLPPPVNSKTPSRSPPPSLHLLPGIAAWTRRLYIYLFFGLGRCCCCCCLFFLNSCIFPTLIRFWRAPPFTRRKVSGLVHSYCRCRPRPLSASHCSLSRQSCRSESAVVGSNLLRCGKWAPVTVSRALRSLIPSHRPGLICAEALIIYGAALLLTVGVDLCNYQQSRLQLFFSPVSALAQLRTRFPSVLIRL